MKTLEKQIKGNKLEKLKLVSLSNIKGGANGITDGTNLPPHPSWDPPTTTECSGGCTSTINPETGVLTPTSGTWTPDWN